MTLVDERVDQSTVSDTDLWAELVNTNSTIHEAFYSFASGHDMSVEESDRRPCVVEIYPGGYRLVVPTQIEYRHEKEQPVRLTAVLLWGSQQAVETLGILPLDSPVFLRKGDGLQVSFDRRHARGWRL